MACGAWRRAPRKSQAGASFSGYMQGKDLPYNSRRHVMLNGAHLAVALQLFLTRRREPSISVSSPILSNLEKLWDGCEETLRVNSNPLLASGRLTI